MTGKSERATAVVILAPRFMSFYRFEADSLEVKLQLMTNRGVPASLTNLDAMLHSPLPIPPVGRGLEEASPMAGYYLESFLKRRGYEAVAVFDWDDPGALERAMEVDPVAVLFSTTFITDPRVLEACLRELRQTVGGTPVIVGGQYINKQAWFMRRRGDQRRAAALRELGVEGSDYLLFAKPRDPVLDDCVFVAAQHGEHTAARVLDRLSSSGGPGVDLSDIPNLVLGGAGKWRYTGRWDEPVDLDTDFTRWDLIDEMPSVVPVRSVLGCTEKCKFCDFRILYPRVAIRSADSIVEEVRAASARGGAFFSFVDDNVFVTHDRATDLCGRFIEEDLGMVWGGFFNVDRVDEENAPLIAGSGFKYGLTGLESGDQRHMERIGKGGDVSMMARGVAMLNELGVNIDLTFMIGFPGETEETLEATARLLNDLPTGLTGYSFFELFPFKLLPGTVADTPYFRRRYDLRGRGSDWSHDTMNYDEVIEKYAPYLFGMVERTPYYHGNIDAPSWWGPRRRDEAFEARAALTVGFLEGADDGEIQRRFECLHALVADEPFRPPGWREILADRDEQPRGEKTR